MRCEEFEDRLNVVIDEGRRGLWDNELWRHWEDCAYCRQVADAYAAMLDGTQSLKSTQAPADLAYRVMADLQPAGIPVRKWSLVAALLATAAGLMIATIPLMRMTDRNAAQVGGLVAAGPAIVATSPATPSATSPSRESVESATVVAVQQFGRFPLVPQIVSMASADDPYRDLARGTGQGLANVFLVTPVIGVNSISSINEPVWFSPVSESLRPVTNSFSETVNLLLHALPLAQL